MSKLKFNKPLFGKIVNLLLRWGIPYRESAVYAYLFLSPKDELSIKELSEASGLSISSVSYALKQLQGRNLVEISRKVGKTKYYVPKPVFYSTFVKEPELVLRSYINPIIEMLSNELKRQGKRSDYTRKLEEALSDLRKLECVLNKVIELFKSPHECENW